MLFALFMKYTESKHEVVHPVSKQLLNFMNYYFFWFCSYNIFNSTSIKQQVQPNLLKRSRKREKWKTNFLETSTCLAWARNIMRHTDDGIRTRIAEVTNNRSCLHYLKYGGSTDNIFRQLNLKYLKTQPSIF